MADPATRTQLLVQKPETGQYRTEHMSLGRTNGAVLAMAGRLEVGGDVIAAFSFGEWFTPPWDEEVGPRPGVVHTRIKTPIRYAAEVIIAGWSPSSGNAKVVSALLLAAHNPDSELVYVGHVEAPRQGRSGGRRSSPS